MWFAGAATSALLLSSVSAVGAQRPGPVESTVEPAGTITLLQDAGWSWFEGARAVFTSGGSALATSAVAGAGSTAAAPGTVLLAVVDLASGARQLVDLGQAEPDDHNSASIDETAGELNTAWTRHNQDDSVRVQRRRTDGSWLRLPGVDTGQRTTYSNLRDAADENGQPILYDFYRGERFDPSVMASADLGRTWSLLGRVLRDPLDRVNTRPYVQYSTSRNGRIDLIATQAHPRESQTAVYHGYIEAGILHDSAGAVLGPLGSAVPVTALTPVWAPAGTERGWTADITVDPITGVPTAVFSVRIAAADHRYWYGQWDGTTWQTEEIAFAGRALYSLEDDYTGLVTLDPVDSAHVVLSTDASPTTGTPLLSSADGQRHWELFDGRRAADGTWTWTPLTSDSTVDNLRPVLTADPSGASALLWLRGRYTTFLDYDLDVVGVVRRADQSIVGSGSTTWAATTDVVPTPAPRSQPGRPVVGHFDGHPADDLFLVRAGTGPEDLFLGDDQRHPTPIASRQVQGSSLPVPGDYDANGRTDIFWYAPGPAVESLWSTTDTARFQITQPQGVNGSYTPIPGDYDGDGRTDIFWYAPGNAGDSLWRSTPSGFAHAPSLVNGTYTPIPGDYDGDGRTDIFWYAPGSATDALWFGTTDGTFTKAVARAVNGTYTPIAGDYDGDGRTDIFWYAPGSATDALWFGLPTRGFRAVVPRQVRGTYTPIPADHDGDGADDILWYVPGTVPDQLWWSAAGPLASIGPAPVDL